MAKTIDIEISEMLAAGKATAVADNKFGKAVRNVDQDPLGVDDIFIIPTDYKVLEAPLFAGGDPVRFIMVNVTNEKTGVSRNMRFFPNQLAKVAYPVINGVTQAKVKTPGTAAKMYQGFADQGAEGMDNAMQALIGKRIKVTAKQAYTVYEFGTTTETTTNIYTYDFA